MSQRSILSFFKSSGQTSKKEETEKSFFKSSGQTSKKEETEKRKIVVVVNDSPVAKTKRKVQCIESDSDTPKKNSINKHRKISKDEIENSSLISVKEENIENEENGDISLKQSPKKNTYENEDGEKTPKFSVKVPSEVSEKENAENVKSKEFNEDCSQQSCIDQKDCIPKRKTARKRLPYEKDLNKHLTNSKNEPQSKEEIEVVIKKEFPIDENPDSKVEDMPELKVENRLSAHETENEVQEQLENKESARNLSSNLNCKQNVLTNKSPLKKNAKKESIQNFFTPMKKSESNLYVVERSKDEKDIKKEKDNETKENNSIVNSLETNDESPLKVKKHKKRSRILESDDEEDEPASEGKPLKEVHEDVEMKDCSSLPKENEAIETQNSILEDKESSKKTSDDDTKSDNTNSESDIKNSKRDGEKQKLNIKSTSNVHVVYDPSKIDYHPIEHACWKLNQKVPYLALAKTLEIIENTSGRLKTIKILSNFFRSVIVLTPDDLLHSIYLCLNRVAPEYEGIEMGVGETLLMKALAQATGRTLDKIKAEVAIKGDLGLVSESSRGNQRVMFAPPQLTVSSVFNKFLEIAKMSGNSAMAKKTEKIKSLFVASRDCEAKYIIRSLSGKLRIGLAEQSVLSAIARAAIVTPPGQDYPPKKLDATKGISPEKFKKTLESQTLILKTAYCECPNYDLIIPILLKKGVSALPDHCQLSPGVPLKPMLAHPTAGIDEVFKRFDKNAFTCEFKYDGERAQIHMNEKGEVKIFSRNQEDNTSKYPDVISRISNTLKDSTKSFILDSEAVAWDTRIKQILPFQVLSTRKRKDAVESEIVVQVCVMAFDLLYLNGESLVKKPLKERRSLLHSSFKEVENQFMFAKYMDGNTSEVMQEFLDESIKGNCEGLMVKCLEVDALYEIAKRSHNWLKIKKDYLQGIGDTLDLVVIGGYYGKGKRTGNYGGFLLACYDEDNEEFQSICKLGTGFKEDDLEAHTTFLKTHVIKEPKSYYRYDQSLQPDEWFESIQVWEIKCADISISPVHKAAIGIVDPEKGVSLRFPRFVRIRDDKTPENATNSVQVADMYKNQQQIQNVANKNTKVEDDFY